MHAVRQLCKDINQAPSGSLTRVSDIYLRYDCMAKLTNEIGFLVYCMVWSIRGDAENAELRGF